MQTLITDPASKKVVDDYRKKLIENCSEEDLEPTVLNDKIVYVVDSLPASRLEPQVHRQAGGFDRFEHRLSIIV